MRPTITICQDTIGHGRLEVEKYDDVLWSSKDNHRTQLQDHQESQQREHANIESNEGSEYK